MVILALGSQDNQAGPPPTENSLTIEIDDIFVCLLDGFNNKVDCSQKAKKQLVLGLEWYRNWDKRISAHIVNTDKDIFVLL